MPDNRTKEQEVTVSIRPMAPDDIDAVIELYDTLDQHHYSQLPSLFRRPETAFRNRDFFTAILDDDQAGIFVAELDHVVGFVEVKVSPAPDLPVFVPQLYGVIDAIFVEPESRRSGVAAALMHAAEAWAKDRGAAGVNLNVYAFNESAQELFSAMGYGTLSKRMSKPV